MRFNSLILIAIGIAWQAHAGVADSLLLVNDPEAWSTDVHVRAKGNDWSLLWDYIDDNNYKQAHVKSLTGAAFDPLFGRSSKITLSKIVDGSVTCSQDFTVTHQMPECSVRLIALPGGLSIYAGDGKRLEADKCRDLHSFDRDHSSSVIYRRHKDADTRRCRVVEQKRVTPQFSRFADRSHLDEYLSTTSDTVEGYWQYLDRDLNAPAVQLGGKYQFAVVREQPGAGDYLVLMLDTPERYPQLWRPMQVKARLHPTVFANNFDAEWINAERTECLTDEVSANIDQNSVLTFYFPLIKSQLRFRRTLR